MFDKVTVAVVNRPNKSLLFNIDERLEMLRETSADLSNVKIEPFEGLLVDCLKDKNIFVIIRGLRAISDFEYEFQIALMNRSLNPRIETVFLMPSQAYTFLSSSLVKEVAKFGGNVESLVPKIVERRMKEKFC